MADPETDNAQILLAAGVPEEYVVEIIQDAIWVYDINRKPKGMPQGAIGSAGCEIYRAILRSPDYPFFDFNAFQEYRPYTAEIMAERLARSRGSIEPAMNRLIAHGFVSKRRVGRQFEIKALLPSIALRELGERWVTQEAELDTHAGDIEQPLGKILLVLFAGPST